MTASRMKKISSCPFCGGVLQKKYSGIRDRLNTTKKTFSIYECASCQSAVLNPFPVGDTSRFYPQNYLSSEKEVQSEEEVSQNTDLEKWYRYNQYNFDFKLLKRACNMDIKDVSSYIDIGCGSGERVTFASEQGCKLAFGVDKLDFAKSRSKKAVRIINSEILAYKPKNKFQVGSLFHVLEHLENPHEVLEHIRKDILKQGGRLIVQVPNYGSYESRFFKNRWFGLDAPRHFWHFNEQSLTRLLEQAGFKVEAAYQLNAALHPVTIVPSIFRKLDVQQIWVNHTHGDLYKKIMKILWAIMTIATIPLAIMQNIFNRSSMLTVVSIAE